MRSNKHLDRSIIQMSIDNYNERISATKVIDRSRVTVFTIGLGENLPGIYSWHLFSAMGIGFLLFGRSILFFPKSIDRSIDRMQNSDKCLCKKGYAHSFDMLPFFSFTHRAIGGLKSDMFQGILLSFSHLLYRHGRKDGI